MQNRRSIIFMAFAMVVYLLVFSFGVTSAQQSEPLKIVASYSILADVVSQITGDAAGVSTLIGVGQDPHSYVPLTADLVRLSEADVIFTNGAQFEEGLLESIENIQTGAPIFEVSACVPMLPFTDFHDETREDVPHEGEPHEDDNHAETSSVPCEDYFTELGLDSTVLEAGTLGLLSEIECGGHESEAGEDVVGCDPHVWMNPVNVMLWSLFIRDTMIMLDPAHEALYRENTGAYLDQLEELAEQVESAVSTIPPENRVLVTNHEALGYFTTAYGFQLIDAVLRGGNTAAEPGAADLANLIERVRESNVPALFSETTVSDTLINTVAAEAGIDVYELYTGSLGNEQSGASTYIDYVRYNVSIIVDALGGNAEF